jgi:hypothetical protein
MSLINLNRFSGIGGAFGFCGTGFKVAIAALD